jgi:hypothetical protein
MCGIPPKSWLNLLMGNSDVLPHWPHAGFKPQVMSGVTSVLVAAAELLHSRQYRGMDYPSESAARLLYLFKQR